MLLKTDRFGIRPLTLQDLEAFFELQSDRSQFRKKSDLPLSSKEEALKLLEEEIEIHELNVSFGHPFAGILGIEMNNSEKLVGVIYAGLGNRIMQFGIWILNQYQKTGIGTEVLNAVMKHAFTCQNTNRIYAETDARNIACIKLLERAEMQREGVFRKKILMNDDTYEDEYIYGILAEEFKTKSYQI